MNTPYYVFYADSFIKNYRELENAFRRLYPDYSIAYSFKTNYTPAVCRLVLDLGGYAEVVSDMEYDLAVRIGFPAERIIYNGPGKQSRFDECILRGGILNVDNNAEIDRVCALAKEHDDLSVGIRVNFDVGNGLHSRFGIDTSEEGLISAVQKLNAGGVSVGGLHFHISRARSLEAWKKRIDTILSLADALESVQDRQLEFIDLGSGMFGSLCDELIQQFGTVPTYDEYAGVVAGTMAEHYRDRDLKPKLFTEPGTTLVSRYFSLFTSVLDIKTIRGKKFALLDCSFQNVGEICSLKRVPIRLAFPGTGEKVSGPMDLVGYTCLEQDVIARDHEGPIGTGDVLEIMNVGGYSIVEKPPFIHPDIPIFMDRNGGISCIKRAQTIDDIFAPYYF